MFDQNLTVQLETVSTEKPQGAIATTAKCVELGSFVMIPQHFIRFQARTLTQAELQVMLYIFDHTLGYIDQSTGGRKLADAISRSQFLNGITRHNGEIVDLGASVSERSLDRALNSLEEKGFIKSYTRTGRDGRYLATIYELDLERAGSTWLQPLPSNTPLSARNSIATSSADKNVMSESLAKATPNISYVKQVIGETNSVIVNKQEGNHIELELPQQRSEVSGEKIPQVVKTTPAKRGDYPRKIAGTTPVKLRDTKENPSKKDSKKTPQKCVTGVRKRVLEIIAANPSRETTTTCETIIASTQLVCPEKALKGSGKALRTLGPVNFKDSRQGKELEEKQALMAELIQAGVSRGEAQNLASIAHTNGHRAGDYVGECLRYIQRQIGVKSRLGLLVHLVKTNWQPPTVQQNTWGKYQQEKLLRSWSKVTGVLEDLAAAEQISDMLTLHHSEVDKSLMENSIALDSSIAPVIYPSQERCDEVWLSVCQKAICEWGVSADLLVGSWLALNNNHPGSEPTLLLHLTTLGFFISFRYKFSQLIRAELGLGPEWGILDANDVNGKIYLAG